MIWASSAPGSGTGGLGVSGAISMSLDEFGSIQR